MTFPKPLTGVKMRGKVGDELWSAGSAEWDSYRAREFFGMLRCQGSPRWQCYHHHRSSAEARTCAAEELARRIKP